MEDVGYESASPLQLPRARRATVYPSAPPMSSAEDEDEFVYGYALEAKIKKKVILVSQEVIMPIYQTFDHQALGLVIFMDGVETLRWLWGKTESACELWKEIKERYGQSNGLLVYQLERDLSKISQVVGTLAKHYASMYLRMYSVVLDFVCNYVKASINHCHYQPKDHTTKTTSKNRRINGQTKLKEAPRSESRNWSPDDELNALLKEEEDLVNAHREQWRIPWISLEWKEMSVKNLVGTGAQFGFTVSGCWNRIV
nr:kinesin-like protein KIN-13B isoform X2 [Tanacetum cinerariifolium]